MTDELDETTDIKAAVEARKKAEAEEHPPEDGADGITPQFVRECFDASRLGDGTLFAALNRGHYLNNLTTKDGWHFWTGHHWRLDDLNKRYAGVELVVAEYEREMERIKDDIREAWKKNARELAGRLEKRRASIRSRIKSLRDDGADKCLTWATRIEGGLGVRGEEFDREPLLLACKNGVIELETGRFRDGRPEDLLTKSVPHEWQGIDAEAPTWEQFLDDVFAGDRELIAYVQRVFGYGITGLTMEHIFLVLLGEGRNGKGTLVETIKHVLGDPARPIQSEMLLDQRSARSSSGPSPDIMALKGLRIAFASETDENRRFSPAKVKWLSGGDTLVGRNPNDKYETVFEPTHLLCLLTNHLPHAPSTDFAFWARVHLVPFDLRFVESPTAENERPRVKDLPDKLKAEAPGILAWLVRGCIDWHQRGLDPPRKVMAATEKARLNEDVIAEFVEAACVEDPDERITYGEVYKAFCAWYEINYGDRFQVKKKKFGALLEHRFRKDKVGGTVYFFGLRTMTELEKLSAETPDDDPGVGF